MKDSNIKLNDKETIIPASKLATKGTLPLLSDKVFMGTGLTS
jgi:hypothetical protein